MSMSVAPPCAVEARRTTTTRRRCEPTIHLLYQQCYYHDTRSRRIFQDNCQVYRTTHDDYCRRRRRRRPAARRQRRPVQCLSLSLSRQSTTSCAHHISSRRSSNRPPALHSSRDRRELHTHTSQARTAHFATATTAAHQLCLPEKFINSLVVTRPPGRPTDAIVVAFAFHTTTRHHRSPV